MKKIAIIGSGISGLAAAYLLKDTYAVSLYEKNNYYGGHARTLTVAAQLPIDTGFIVFNHKTYPHLTRLFRHLGVPIKKSDMSFGVSINQGAMEYGSKKLLSLFSQRSHFFQPSFWKMLWDILKFNRISKKHLHHRSLSADLSLEDYVRTLGVSDWFCDYYLFAMGAAIWSTPAKKIQKFSALTFLQFFDQHGLLDIQRPIPWYTVDGGSQVYVRKIIDALQRSQVTFFGAAQSVIRQEKVTVIDAQTRQDYDKIIFATHTDQALALLANATAIEQKQLSALPYQKNTAILHQDPSFMPKRFAAWSSWIYLSNQGALGQQIALTYWMNNLQALPSSEQYFVTLNPEQQPAAARILDEHAFEHPMLTPAARAAQEQIENIQGENNTYYCGAYLGYGFHEDGLHSAVQVAHRLGVEVPW